MKVGRECKGEEVPIRCTSRVEGGGSGKALEERHRTAGVSLSVMDNGVNELKTHGKLVEHLRMVATVRGADTIDLALVRESSVFQDCDCISKGQCEWNGDY
jgi:hypothetical protein